MPNIIHLIQDPFYAIFIICVIFIAVFSYYQNKNEKEIREHIKDKNEVIFLPTVSAKYRASSIGTQRAWFKVSMIFTPDSIFVFGGTGRAILHFQYYSKLNASPTNLIWPKKNFIPVDKIEFDEDDLIIHYISPHWHKANCTLRLKNVLKMDEFQSILLLLTQGFGLQLPLPQ